ncbi:hypothetical protein, partial [Streptomyces sp. bgisy082]|uniref:hypothetical protein n=1 Tax=Streptomyces sp. bgisy082 TaxID=3413776 RepID=UPI003D717F3F
MTAVVEEVVVDGEVGGRAEDADEEGEQGLFERGARGTAGGGDSGRLGKGPLVDLAVGRERQPLQDDDVCGYEVLGEPVRHVPPDLLRV